jgi:hypothetical protein
VVQPSRVDRPRRVALLIALAHALLVLALCPDLVLLGRVPYVRDVAFLYVPDLAFLARSLAQHVWPVWNPLIDGGRPVLFSYPPDLLLAALLGPLGAARAEVPLHLWWAAAGASSLAWVRGRGPLAAWAAGALYATSGYVLACGNVFPILQGAAWAPWVIAAGLAVLDRPGRRRIAGLAVASALQVGSLAAELIVQTAALIVVLGARRGDGRGWARLAAAAALSLLLSAPTLLGARAMAQGTAREGRFGREATLSWSVAPAEMPAIVLPAYFGDMHTFSDVGFWGQDLFDQGYPYFLSIYLGPVVLLLAAFGLSPRLALVALGGLAIALGLHGPLAPVVGVFMSALRIRVPAKFLLSTVIAVTAMAGDGVERLSARRAPAWAMLPGLALGLVALALLVRPAAVIALLGHLSASAHDPRAIAVFTSVWPGALLRTAALALVAGLACWRGGRLTALAAAAAVADLVVAGAPLDPSAPPSFYTLRAPLRAQVEQARGEGPFRWFSYGAAVATPLSWRADLVAANRDRPLFEIEVQSLAPRTQELVDLEGAFDEDRTGFAPRGSTLAAGERRPSRFREVLPRLRSANVRWVLAYERLPEDLVRARAEIAQPEVREPLRLYEIADPLPRVSWVADLGWPSAGGPSADGAADVSLAYERIDAHTLRLRASTPPGFIVVRDRFDPGWRARDEGGEVALVPLGAESWALRTPGGSRTITARFAPAWRAPALALAGLGALLTVVLAARPRAEEAQPAGAAAARSA